MLNLKQIHSRIADIVSAEKERRQTRRWYAFRDALREALDNPLTMRSFETREVVFNEICNNPLPREYQFLKKWTLKNAVLLFEITALKRQIFFQEIGRRK